MRRNLVAGLLAILVLLVLVVVSFAVYWFVDPESATTQGSAEVVKARTELVKIIVSIATALAAAGGLIFTGLSFQLSQRTLAISQQTLATTERRQLADRFAKAVEQLDGATTAVRLGGIYALEQIAIDAAEYHWPVVEVLTAYVRTNASVSRALRKRPTGEIQAILTILGRRQQIAEREIGRRLDLRQTDLSALDLREAVLHGTPIRKGTGVDLRGARLWGTKLDGARLQGADFDQADLRDATLLAADLSYADLRLAENVSEEQFRSAQTNDQTTAPAKWR